jgi:hypothetical protein
MLGTTIKITLHLASSVTTWYWILISKGYERVTTAIPIQTFVWKDSIILRQSVMIIIPLTFKPQHIIMCSLQLRAQCLHFISDYIVVRADYVQHCAILWSAQITCATWAAHTHTHTYIYIYIYIYLRNALHNPLCILQYCSNIIRVWVIAVIHGLINLPYNGRSLKFDVLLQCFRKVAVHLQNVLEVMSTSVDIDRNPFNFIREHFLQIWLYDDRSYFSF